MPTVAEQYYIQGLKASKPEYVIGITLEKMGIDFKFQTEFTGGRDIRGGFIADFLIFVPSIIISVLGEYWHYALNRTASDILQALGVQSIGIRTIFIDESDALKNPRYYIEEALRGIDHSRLANR